MLIAVISSRNENLKLSPRQATWPHPAHGPGACKIIESQDGLGWKGPYRSSSSHTPDMGRDPFHQPRVLKAPSSLALDTAREGAATASPGNLCQGLTTLRGKNSFLISNLNLPSFSLKPSPLVLSLQALVQSPSPALSQPLQALAAALRSARSLPFPRLSSPSSPSLSSQQRGSNPQVYIPSGPLSRINIIFSPDSLCLNMLTF